MAINKLKRGVASFSIPHRVKQTLRPTTPTWQRAMKGSFRLFPLQAYIRRQSFPREQPEESRANKSEGQTPVSVLFCSFFFFWKHPAHRPQAAIMSEPNERH